MRTSLKFPMALAAVLSVISVSWASPSQEWQARVSKDLLSIYAGNGTAQGQGIQSQGNAPKSTMGQNSRARFDAKGRVQLDVKFDCNAAAPIGALKAAGLVIGSTVKIPPMCVVEGWAATAALPAIASVASVEELELPHYAKSQVPITSSGLPRPRNAMSQGTGGTPVIDGNGVTIMNADKYIAQTGATGAGITVAVINSGADSLSVIQARNELPQVNVVQPSANPAPPANSDEGTMMLEEVHAVAPGASLAFCGPQTFVEYVACVQGLIAANVTIITDDLLFPGWDVMSAPIANVGALAIQNLLVANPRVMIFSAAGNNAKNYWQGAYTPIPINAGSFTCQGQTDN